MFKTLHIFAQKLFLQCKEPEVKVLSNLSTYINSYFQTVTQCATQLWDLPTSNVPFIRLDLYLIEIYNQMLGQCPIYNVVTLTFNSKWDTDIESTLGSEF